MIIIKDKNHNNMRKKNKNKEVKIIKIHVIFQFFIKFYTYVDYTYVESL